MKEYKPFKSGKVREVYDAGDSIIMVATDRISAFDHILKNKITQKGQVLTQMSKFWFDLTADIVPNHMISVDNKDMPEFFQQEQFQGNSMMCKKLTMLPMECIVRGYITGSYNGMAAGIYPTYSPSGSAGSVVHSMGLACYRLDGKRILL